MNVLVADAAQFCDACGKAKHNDKNLLKCSKCRKAFYHDKECQKNHWPKHKDHCRHLVQLQQEEQAQVQNLKVLLGGHTDDDKGRVVVALKEFSPGDVVLLESPAVIFDTRLGYLGLLAAFGAATQETQQKVLNLHAPPLEQLDSEARRQRHARLEQQRLAHLHQHPNLSTMLTTEMAQKLLAIIETNAHELVNVNSTTGDDNSNDNNSDNHQWMGLFCLGSMIEHSCNPNLTINNNTREGGRLEFLAERSIAKGDRLSTSYIEGIYEKSLQQRQALLLDEKHFYCSCDRCQGLDECRPIIIQLEKEQLNCQTSSSHPVFWHASHKQFICFCADSNNNALSLQMDDSMVVEFFRVENELKQSINELEQSMLMETTTRRGIPDCFQSVLTQLAALMTGSKWRFAIHPLHWLNVSACQLLSQAASAAARIQQQQQQPPQQLLDHVSLSLLRLSTLALLHNLTWVEQTVRILRQPTPVLETAIVGNATTENNMQANTTALLREIVIAIKETEKDNQGTNNNNTSLPVQLMTILQSILVNVSKSNGRHNDEHQQVIFVPPDDLKRAVGMIVRCSTTTPLDETSVTADSLLTAFFAGQDLLRAGHVDLCRLLYQRYQSWFHKLKQPNDENRVRIDVLLASSQTAASANPFANRSCS